MWEAAERTERHGEEDGVAVLARVVSRSAPPAVVVISQFRPPMGGKVLELPAGLTDPGEGPAAVALRELREETGAGRELGRGGWLCTAGGKPCARQLLERAGRHRRAFAKPIACRHSSPPILPPPFPAGYSGRVVSVSPAAANDAGMLTSSLRLVVVEVDGDGASNRAPVQELEVAEDISVHLLPVAGLLGHLEVRG